MRTDASWLDRGMIVRLGNVLYWTACILTALVAAFTLFDFVTSSMRQENWLNLAFGGAIGLGVWLVGRALKYILTGRLEHPNGESRMVTIECPEDPTWKHIAIQRHQGRTALELRFASSTGPTGDGFNPLPTANARCLAYLLLAAAEHPIEGKISDGMPVVTRNSSTERLALRLWKEKGAYTQYCSLYDLKMSGWASTVWVGACRGRRG